MSANSGSVFWQVKSKRTDRFSALNSSSDNTEISKNTLWQFGFYKKKKKAQAYINIQTNKSSCKKASKYVQSSVFLFLFKAVQIYIKQSYSLIQMQLPKI